MDAPDVDVPQFLNPLLNYLSSTLPPTLYNIAVELLLKSISLFFSLSSLVKTLASSSPSSWDAQAILPPLITLLATYLALVSFYRTTSWMIRTGIWFMKWGAILSALAAGAGWMMGNAHANGENGIGGLFTGGGVVPTVGGMILDMINGQGQNAAGGARSSRSSRTQKQKAPRPKAWESWDRHREWQYSENAQNEDDNAGNGMQKILGDVFGAVREAGWWEAAKGAVDGFSQAMGDNVKEDVSDGKQPQQGAKTQTKMKAGSR